MKRRIIVILSLIMSLAFVASCSVDKHINDDPNLFDAEHTKLDDEEMYQDEELFATTDHSFDHSLVQIAHADMNYQTTSIKGIASVSDTIVMGRIEAVESYVTGDSNPHIETRGRLIPTDVLLGDVEDSYTVVMVGGTVPYESIAKLYTEDELTKYGIDPDNDQYENITSIFENMVPFAEDETYLFTLSANEDGTYQLLPSLYSLARITDSSNAVEVQTEEAVSFNVNNYVTTFKGNMKP